MTTLDIDPERPRRRWLQRSLGGLGALMATLGLSTVIPGCKVGYVVKSSWFQAELLASRVPVEKVRAREQLSTEQLAALDTIADVKAYGAEVGLSATDNYGTIAWGWDRTIWNVSACDPLAFEPETWWFPVVGRVPYLGFFREEDARRQADKLGAKGADVYVRTAGAYSTLGWFRDPILMGMLDWGTYSLADTVLHELAHATVWIPGSVGFNESFANFVGEEAAFRYLDHRFGPTSELSVRARQRFEDLALWRVLQHTLYTDLEILYAETDRPEAERLAAKQAIFDSLHDRVDDAGFHDADRFHRAVDRNTWNNARLIQFKTYNNKRPVFEALLERNNSDLLAFMHDTDRIVRAHDDLPPFEALRTELGMTEGKR